jgi:hypothetical protein
MKRRNGFKMLPINKIAQDVKLFLNRNPNLCKDSDSKTKIDQFVNTLSVVYKETIPIELINSLIIKIQTKGR